jgi:hypothetical protein
MSTKQPNTPGTTSASVHDNSIATAIAFTEEEIEDLLPELDEVWPSFMDASSNENFWVGMWVNSNRLLSRC